MLLLMVSLSAVAQDKKAKVKVQEPKAPKVKPDYSKLDLSKRASDHFMLQFGIAGWGNKDANNITTKSFNRSFNGYFLFDFPFKSNPHLSVAVGPGVGSDNIYRTQVLGQARQHEQGLEVCFRCKNWNPGWRESKIQD